MSYAVKVLADSMNPYGNRLTTLEVTFPRIILAEFNTHRMLSRNSASSRAIPVEKRIAQIRENPFVPEAFARNQKGMQAGSAFEKEEQARARDRWMRAMESALFDAGQLAEIGVHKQWANRLLEPFSWHTVIVTATEWSNFFALRCHPDAQPEIRTIAEMMRDAMAASVPEPLAVGEWHLPLIREVDYLELDEEQLVQCSVARCARVSYLTHDGRRDIGADLALYQRLAEGGHLSPFEHAAQAGDDDLFIGNFAGWEQHRKAVDYEDDFALACKHRGAK